MNSDQLLSTGDVLEITNESAFALTLGVSHKGGLTAKEFKTWCSLGVVVPVEGGHGPGSHRRFSKVQAVAIAFATQWWRVGIGLEMLKPIIDCITKFDEPGLVREIEEGRRAVLFWPWYAALIPLPDFCILADHPGAECPCLLDLDYVYKAVTRAIAELSQRPRNHRGRNRGLGGEQRVFVDAPVPLRVYRVEEPEPDQQYETE